MFLVPISRCQVLRNHCLFRVLVPTYLVQHDWYQIVFRTQRLGPNMCTKHLATSTQYHLVSGDPYALLGTVSSVPRSCCRELCTYVPASRHLVPSVKYMAAGSLYQCVPSTRHRLLSYLAPKNSVPLCTWYKCLGVNSGLIGAPYDACLTTPALVSLTTPARERG